MKLIPRYCETIQAEIRQMEADITVLDLALAFFEAEQELTGGPRDVWINQLPPEIGAAYDLHWELSEKVYILDDGYRLDAATEGRPVPLPSARCWQTILAAWREPRWRWERKQREAAKRRAAEQAEARAAVAGQGGASDSAKQETFSFDNIRDRDIPEFPWTMPHGGVH